MLYKMTNLTGQPQVFISYGETVVIPVGESTVQLTHRQFMNIITIPGISGERSLSKGKQEVVTSSYSDSLEKNINTTSLGFTWGKWFKNLF